MKENMIIVESGINATVVIDVPEIQLRRVWNKAGSKYLIDRDSLEQAYYNPSVETLFKQGALFTNDKQFLTDVGLIDSEEDELPIVKVDDKMFNRMISVMPLSEFKTQLIKLTDLQKIELVDYAIDNYNNLKMDRVDILSKATGKNILKAIENIKADKEV